ncbi:MAG: OmpA family protein [Thermoguttaceae bacterium]
MSLFIESIRTKPAFFAGRFVAFPMCLLALGLSSLLGCKLCQNIGAGRGASSSVSTLAPAPAPLFSPETSASNQPPSIILGSAPGNSSTPGYMPPTYTTSASANTTSTQTAVASIPNYGASNADPATYDAFRPIMSRPLIAESTTPVSIANPANQSNPFSAIQLPENQSGANQMPIFSGSVTSPPTESENRLSSKIDQLAQKVVDLEKALLASENRVTELQKATSPKPAPASKPTKSPESAPSSPNLPVAVPDVSTAQVTPNPVNSDTISETRNKPIIDPVFDTIGASPNPVLDKPSEKSPTLTQDRTPSIDPFAASLNPVNLNPATDAKSAIDAKSNSASNPVPAVATEIIPTNRPLTPPAVSIPGVSVSANDKQIRVEITDKLLFIPGLWQISPAGEEAMRKVTAEIRANYPDAILEIEGHTDNIEIDPTNKTQKQELSANKATVVMQYMVNSLRWNPAQISTSGHGSRRPVEENGTPEGRARNNRTEIVITPKL